MLCKDIEHVIFIEFKKCIVKKNNFNLYLNLQTPEFNEGRVKSAILLRITGERRIFVSLLYDSVKKKPLSPILVTIRFQEWTGNEI